MVFLEKKIKIFCAGIQLLQLVGEEKSGGAIRCAFGMISGNPAAFEAAVRTINLGSQFS